MFADHSHRLPGMVMGLITIGLVCSLLIFVQLTLAATMRHNTAGWTMRQPHMTTAHVVVGALTFWLTWMAHRDQIEVNCRQSARP